MLLKVNRIAIAVALAATSVPASAQWLNYKVDGLPRKADGTFNYTAPAPKLADGHPDLSGIWLGDNWNPPGRRTAEGGGRGGRGGGGRGGGIPKMLPEAQKVYDERRVNQGRDDPEARCMPQGVPKASTLPYPFELIQAPGKLVMLYEMYSLRRMIYSDGRQLPKEFINPSWMGYSVGKWEGDEFVADTTGFNDKVWNVDLGGHPHSDAMHVYERFKRIDFGHMDVSVTVDDPKTYEGKWTQVMRYTLLPDTDLLEFVCDVNIDPVHMVGK